VVVTSAVPAETTDPAARAVPARSRRAGRPDRRPGARRSRVRRRVVGGVVVLVVVLAAAWGLVGSRAWVQPGGASSWSPGLVQEVGSVTGLDTGVVWLVDDEQGWVLVGVRNGGPLPVTLEAVPPENPAVSVALEPAGGPAVQRLTLAPGDSASVRVSLDVTCVDYADGVGESFATATLRATTLGRTRTQGVPLQPQLGVMGPHVAACG